MATATRPAKDLVRDYRLDLREQRARYDAAVNEHAGLLAAAREAREDLRRVEQAHAKAEDLVLAGHQQSGALINASVELRDARARLEETLATLEVKGSALQVERQAFLTESNRMRALAEADLTAVYREAVQEWVTAAIKLAAVNDQLKAIEDSIREQFPPSYSTRDDEWQPFGIIPQLYWDDLRLDARDGALNPSRLMRTLREIRDTAWLGLTIQLNWPWKETEDPKPTPDEIRAERLAAYRAWQLGEGENQGWVA